MTSPFLYYITQADPSASHAAQAAAVCRAGVRWVQLRIKGAPFESWCRAAHEVVAVCRQYGARCLINDSIEVAAASGADGVHLGATDPDPRRARQILGTTAIIGVTAHNSEEAVAAVALPVDYIGVGPYRFTTTKHDLSPLLGLSGVVRLCSEIKSRRPELAVIAVGGITLEDCPALYEGGIDGVAMSGALMHRAKTEGWLKVTLNPDEPNSELQ